jgi:hypothetical protein
MLGKAQVRHQMIFTYKETLFKLQLTAWVSNEASIFCGSHFPYASGLPHIIIANMCFEGSASPHGGLAD